MVTEGEKLPGMMGFRFEEDGPVNLPGEGFEDEEDDMVLAPEGGIQAAGKMENSRQNHFLLAGLLSVRCAPVSEGTKACKEAKAKRRNRTKPSKKTKHQQKNATQPKTPQPQEAFAASETSETAFTQNRWNMSYEAS